MIIYNSTQMSFKIGVLQKFRNRKTPVLECPVKSAILRKRDSNTGVFL